MNTMISSEELQNEAKRYVGGDTSIGTTFTIPDWLSPKRVKLGSRKPFLSARGSYQISK
jgi:hypothetical protein